MHPVETGSLSAVSAAVQGIRWWRGYVLCSPSHAASTYRLSWSNLALASWSFIQHFAGCRNSSRFTAYSCGLVLTGAGAPRLHIYIYIYIQVAWRPFFVKENKSPGHLTKLPSGPSVMSLQERHKNTNLWPTVLASWRVPENGERALGPKGTWLYSNHKELLSPLYLPLPKDKVWDAEMSTKILVLTKRHQKTICIMCLVYHTLLG